MGVRPAKLWLLAVVAVTVAFAFANDDANAPISVNHFKGIYLNRKKVKILKHLCLKSDKFSIASKYICKNNIVTGYGQTVYIS